MPIKRVMGTETEYGIMHGRAQDVVAAYQGKKKKHANYGKTNASIVRGMTDVGGHIGGDYGGIEEQIAESGLHFPVTQYGYFPGRQSPIIDNHAEFYSSGDDDIIDNGSRFYVDMGHPELCTPETSNPRDLVIYDKAGEIIVSNAAKAAGLAIKIFKNNSDGKGNSYGCHENYLVKRFSEANFKKVLAKGILPFFITRQIFTGAGKIGLEEEAPYSNFHYRIDSDTETQVDSYKRAADNFLEAVSRFQKYFVDIPEYSDLEKNVRALLKEREKRGQAEIFQLSQRADFFTDLIGLGTTFDRPIINTRDEPHADQSKYMRLHVINGDANMSEISTYLKVGTTSLVLDLIEDGHVPNINLARPISTFQSISRDLSRKWIVDLVNGKTSNAIEIQRMYLDQAVKHYTGRDKATDDVLKRWTETLDALASNPMQLNKQLDWVIKLNLVNQFMEAEGVKMTSDMMRNIALQYHDVDREKGIFYHLQSIGAVDRIVTDVDIDVALKNPPNDTRAYLRARASEIKDVSSVDWSGFIIGGDEKYTVRIMEPLAGTEKQVKKLIDSYKDPKEFANALSKIKGIKVDKPSQSFLNRILGRKIRNYWR